MGESADTIPSLIEALTQGRTEAWAPFFTRADPLIRSVVAWPKWRFAPHVQEDLVQAIRAEIVKSVERLSQVAHVESFIRRVCVNRCIDEVRRQVREHAVLVPLAFDDEDGQSQQRDLAADGNLDPYTLVAKMELADGLREVLQNADSTCRESIEDFYYHGLSYSEIATKNCVALDTVGSRLSRCLDKLRKVLKHHNLFKDLFGSRVLCF